MGHSGSFQSIRESSIGGISTGQEHPTKDGRSRVGFRGMEERIRYLGGNLKIHSDSKGTVVAATLPI
jgi:signal transduction histidine kinase